MNKSTLDIAGADSDMLALDKVMSDPKLRSELMAIKKRANDLLSGATDQIVNALQKDKPLNLSSSGLMSGGSMRGAALSLVSRRVTIDVNERRKLAESIAIGTLLNVNNPDWNPNKAATDKSSYAHPVVALMRMENKS